MGIGAVAAAPASSSQGLRWRLLHADGVNSLAAGLLVLAIGSLLFGALATGAAGDILPALVLLIGGLIFIHVFVASHSFADAEERRWLLGLTRVAFLLRATLAIVILYGPWDRNALGEDQAGYDHYPRVIAAYWSGVIERPVLLSSEMIQSRIGYYNLVSLQYYLLAPIFILPRLMNCLAGALMVFYAQSLASLVFGRQEGRITAAWATVFPSLLLWSSVNLRDVWLALSVLVIVCHAIRLRQQFSITSIGIILAHLVWIQYNRSYLVLIMAAVIVAIFFLGRSNRMGRDFLMGAVLLGAVLILHRGMGLGQEGLEWLDLEKISTLRTKLARADVGRSGYLGNLSLDDPAVLISFFPVLLAYFLFSPFPWEMTAFRRLITLPEMVVWYWMIPFVWLAVKSAFKYKIHRHLVLLLPVMVITVAFALPSANVGLAYRYRAQVIGLILPFAAAGYLRRRAPALANQTIDPPALRRRGA